MSLNHTFYGKVLPCMLALSVSGALSAAYSDHGRVDMQGSIIDTPCAIATADLSQSIDMGDTTLGEIYLNGRGRPKPFSLNLVNCVLSSGDSARSHFRTTFDGPSAKGLFSVSGAKGVGLQITDSTGNVAVPGEPLPAGILTPGSQRLDYNLRLVSDLSHLKAGDYHAILRFKVDYL